MSAITPLRRNTANQLAEASGAPRALVTVPTHPDRSADATVIRFKTSTTQERMPGTTTTTHAGTESHKDPATTHPRPADAPLPLSADRETTQRISGIARSVAQGALEVLGGARPLQQMARWLDPDNYERLQLRANLVRCIGVASPTESGRLRTSTLRQVVVRSARVCAVAPGIYEASVVAFDQKRVRAVALRIEQRRGAWRVTALEIG